MFDLQLSATEQLAHDRLTAWSAWARQYAKQAKVPLAALLAHIADGHDLGPLPAPIAALNALLRQLDRPQLNALVIEYLSPSTRTGALPSSESRARSLHLSRSTYYRRVRAAREALGEGLRHTQALDRAA